MMTKSEFMRELESLLSKLPQNEKRDALEYYSDYFAEAGITEDMLVPASVGTPAEIADTIIKEAIGGEDKATASKEENSDTKYYYSDQRSKDWNLNETTTGQTNTGYAGHENKDNTKLIVAIVLLVVFSPAIIGVVAGVGGTLIGVLAALFGIFIGFVVGGIALVVAAFMSSGLSGGIMIAGGGLLMVSIGLGSGMLLTLFVGRFIPWVIKMCTEFGQWLMGKKEQII